MAAPIAHIFCALFFLSGGLIEVQDEAAFIIGTSFPDIRYLGVIERAQTHEEHVTWHDVENAATSFEQGRLLHCLLDLEREKFVVKHNLYNCVPSSLFHTQMLKFYEDTLLYATIDNWSDIAHYFDTVLAEECAYGIKQHVIMLWHSIVKQYIVRSPDAYSIFLLLQQYTAAAAQQESNIAKSLLICCKGAIINRILYVKCIVMMRQLKKSKKLKAAMTFFYKNINKFLMNGAM